MSEERIKETILNIISRYLDLKKVRVFLFGSRAAGYAGRFSDYDVGLKGPKPLSLRTLALIKTELEESDLPIHVEVVDFRQVSQDFKNFALKSAQLWKKS